MDGRCMHRGNLNRVISAAPVTKTKPFFLGSVKSLPAPHKEETRATKRHKTLPNVVKPVEESAGNQRLKQGSGLGDRFSPVRVSKRAT